MTNPKPVGANKWSSATLKAPWFDDETPAGSRSDAAVEAALDNDLKSVAGMIVVAADVIAEMRSRDSSESSH